MPKVGVVLSGCGVFDGAEIHESVITMLALDRSGADYQCMAPDVEQMHVVNHLTGQEAEGESRNVLVESARIARGEVVDMAGVTSNDVDAVIFPGGFGAAKNLCDFAVKGTDCDVHPEVLRLVREMHEAGKPIGVVCIAPAMMAKVMEDSGSSVDLTIGTDEETAAAIESMGASHVSCPVEEFVVDRENKIVSTPAYMSANRITEVEAGVTKLVDEVLKLI
ncbi:MAG: isoprenoid biosynthesis glyoxalase ElbB [Candidatus Marinimicrobia bacterium]|jgi:enhancing lycopene biosynthesis protein 2|nr:isoprenoid biosynthesis glyoxalase ElbB [Candidatus Neomarinimicrobiota bacterium]|tara:strand:+ start:257 stop:919 length:663 start_codon:yes stop_codon:yes gene_type:complete